MRFRSSSPAALVGLFLLCLVTGLATPRSYSQQPAPPGPGASGRGAADPRDDDKPAPPEELDLFTDDGFTLKATYYPGPISEKTPPVIMLHDFKGNRNVFRPLALALQAEGFAVLAADLRGHGGSTRYRNPLTSQAGELLATDLKRPDFEAMAVYDVEALRRYLRDKNNKHELNLNALSLIGADMGALVATLWSARDWSAPPLPGGKQGQDVKALVLLSPPWTYEMIPIRQGLEHPLLRTSVSLLVVVGERRTSSLRDARRVFGEVERFHPEPQDDTDKDLFFVTEDTSLEGAALLGAPDLNVAAPIQEFLQRRIAKLAFPWSPRISLAP